ncbi:MAG TPA: TonB-dependent receptor, partial [Caulobacter sp.]|nr:TonB-dependent receptor [Caulobacter sp.]
MRVFRTTLLMTAVSGLALCAGAAHAAQPGAPVAEPVDGQVEELIVTAQKREQKALDVPIALTAYSGAMLDKLGVQEFDKLSAFVPGFQVQNQSPNNPGFVMRGITSDSGEATVEPRVSVFQDGVSISKSRGSYVELFDVQRIEVAKGPQSTLFGRGAMIGAVNIIQNKADPKALDWRVGAELGDHGYGLFEGMANVPLSDTFALRLAGRYKERDGAIENVLGGRNLGSTDTGALRLSAHWSPTARLDADLIVNYEADHPTGTAFKSNSFNPTNIATGQALGDRDPNSPAGLSSGYGFEGGAALGLKRFVQGATALVDYRFNDAWTLSSITAARHFASEEVFDPDGFSLPMFVFAEDARGRQYSQELRLNYDNGGKISWFGGVSYFDEDARTRVPLQFDERYALALLTSQLTKPNPQPTAVLTNTAFLSALVTGLTGGAATGAVAQGIASNLGVHTEQFTNYGTTQSWDVYGDATWHVTDRFELSAGLRYTRDDKSSGVGSQVSQRSILGGTIGALSLPAATRQ